MKTYNEILEFDKILLLLRNFIKTEAGKKVFDNLKPLNDKQAILDEFAILKEVVEYLKYDGQLYFEEADSIERSIETSNIEGYFLSIEEILQIQKYLIIFKNLCEAIFPYKDKYPLLFDFLSRATLPADLLKKLSDTFENDGTVRDTASQELYRIRKRKSSIREEVQQKCNTIFQIPELQDCFQEKIVAFKDGRFVIPVKTSYKGKIKFATNSIIHSFSKTRETVYVEPEDLFYLNEEVVELDEKEAIEIESILKEVTIWIRERQLELKKIYEIVGNIEWLVARAKFCIKNNCQFPSLTENCYVRLIEARHPLLFENAVPVSVEVGKNFNGLIVSGPNAGGKTVLIKTVGLLIQMTLHAIPIPVKEGSEVGIFKKIMAEIGDEQSISNNLSSFSAHILSLSNILKEADEKSLVLIDEIASSTEPKEGEAIAYGIIKELIKKKVKFIITTHYQGLKKMALFTREIQNGAMEFDEANFLPLYKLQIGKYGKSYALQIAQRYGLSQNILDFAKDYLTSISDELDKKISDFERLTDEIMKRKKIVDENLRKAKEIKSYYESLKRELENEKENFKKNKFEEIRLEYDNLLKEISHLKNELKSRKIENRKKFQEKLEEIREIIEKNEREQTGKEKKKPEKLVVGDRVFVAKYQKEGYIETISDEKVKVRMGLLSVFVDKEDIYLSSQHENKKNTVGSFYIENPPFTIDIRGTRVEEALKILEKAIDKAIINGVNTIEILHGKGEGILRKAVHDYLKSVSEIKNFDYARPEEGGQGKTIVNFK